MTKHRPKKFEKRAENELNMESFWELFSSLWGDFLKLQKRMLFMRFRSTF